MWWGGLSELLLHKGYGSESAHEDCVFLSFQSHTVFKNVMTKINF